MTWGLTEKGFNRPNQSDLQDITNQYFREEFGEDVNVSPKSPTGILSGFLAYIAAKQFEEAEKVYHSAHPSEAEGVQLDFLSAFYNTSRNPELYAEVPLSFVGTPFFTIAAGTRFETESGVDFALKEDVLLNVSGIGSTDAVSVEPGIIGNVGVGMITVQSEPSSDIFTVTNEIKAEGGRDKETNEEFRARMLNSGASIGSGTVNAIYADILNLPGVRAANIIVNNTNAAVNGQPAHSNQLFTLGGDPQAIADTLMEHFTGIQFFGTTTKTVYDIGGNAHVMGFTLAVSVSIYTTITLTTDNTFESDGVTQVKNAIVKLIGGTATDGTVYAGLSMGDDVIYSRILSTVINIPGVVDATIKLGKAASPTGTANIAINVNEVAQVIATNIIVTV